VTVAAGQNCKFDNGCQIRGNLTIAPPNGPIPGGMVYLNCKLDGVLNDNGGDLLRLGGSATVYGNVNITDSSAFTIGSSAKIVGNLNITDATGSQQGSVSGATITQNVAVQGSQSPIQINANTIGENLNCSGNNPVPTGSNTVSGKGGVSCTN
jgi:hypothetical protein